MVYLIPKRILLIEPPFYRLFKETYSLKRYPLSLGYLALAIKNKTTWDVKIYNSDFTTKEGSPIKVSYLTNKGFGTYLKTLKNSNAKIWEEIKNVILEYKPSVIGISIKSQNLDSALMVAKIAKKINKDIKIIVGGPHPSMVGRELLKYHTIDLVVKGEGEFTLVNILKRIENNKSLESIKGICYRKGQIFIETYNQEFIKDLDSLGFPYTIASEVLIDYNLYPPTAFSHMFSTRGCPFNCFFCGSRKIWGRKVRFRSPKNIIAEIKGLQQRGIKIIHFDDDTFGATKSYIKLLCSEIIIHCKDIKWSCEMPIRLVQPELIDLMKKAGCFLINVGIESGNNYILKKMRKGITIEKALSDCDMIKKKGLNVSAFFMVGFPYETEKTLKDTLNAIKKIKCDGIIYSIFTPYPGTEAFEFCKRKKLIKEPHNPSLYNHQSPLNCFCINISHKKFRELVYIVEKTVDQKNRIIRLKKFFSTYLFLKIKEEGIISLIKKAFYEFRI